MKYFALVQKSTAPKNNLQKEMWEMVIQLSNRITDDIELAVVDFRNKVDSINLKYPRCQPMAVHESRHSTDSVGLFVRLKEGDQGPGINLIYHLVKT